MNLIVGSKVRPICRECVQLHAKVKCPRYLERVSQLESQLEWQRREDAILDEMRADLKAKRAAKHA